MAKGPLLKIKPGTILGTKQCGDRNCSRTVEVKVNVGGWPYSFCIEPQGGCGFSPTTKGASWRTQIEDVEKWSSGDLRSACFEILEADGVPIVKRNENDQAAEEVKATPKRKADADAADADAADDADDDDDDDDDGKQWWES